jgi:ABC-type transport system involved in multi-copper enzyme maturation permease subunit
VLFRSLSIARTTFVQQFRNRLYLVVILFGVLMLASSLLFGAMAADQEIRVILDLGLSATELFGLATAVFGAVTLVLEEMESRTIYLILTRPLPRPIYIVGRFVGLLLAVWASMAGMELLHVALLKLKGWEMEPRFLAVFPLMALKVMVATALALLCSLSFTSSASALVFTAFFWVLGHFGPELRFLAEKAGSAAAQISVKVVLFLLPNLQVLNARDLFEIPGFPMAQLAHGALYALLYTGAAVALSTALFSRKEF